MLLGVAGPGGQFPRPVPVPHIIQGVLGIRFAPLLLYLRHAGFSTIFARFCRFSPILHSFLYFWPPGPTPRTELGAGTQKQGAGNHKPPGWGREKPRTGRGARPRTAQRRGGGRPAAPIPGAERRPAPEGGDPPREPGTEQRNHGRAAAGGETGARGQKPGAGQHSGAGGQRPGGHRAAREPPAGHRPRHGRAERGTHGSRKGRRFAPPAAYRRCFVRQGRRSKRVGVVAPPRARNQPGQTPRRHPATGGARPHPAPRCRFVVRGRQRTGPLAPGGRWRDGVETGSLFALLCYIISAAAHPLTPIRGSGNAAARGRFSMRPSNTLDRGIRRASGALGAVHPGDGASHPLGRIIGPPFYSIRPRRQRGSS